MSIFLFCCLCESCGESQHEETFREKIDKAKERLGDEDFAVSTYSVDSSANWSVISQITQQKKSTAVNVSFRQKGSLIKEVKNQLDQKYIFHGRLITKDAGKEVSMCYYLTGEKNDDVIYEVSCKSTGESSIKKLDSAKTKGWNKLKLQMLTKQ